MKNQSKGKTIYNKIIEQISGVFLPILNCLTAASILKSLLIILAAAGVVDTGGGLYMLFYAASDGFFYFLPFYLAYTASKQWKTDTMITMFIPVAMLYPDLLAIIEGGGALSFLGLNVPNTTYHSSVLPVLMAVGLLKFIEKPCDRWIPEAVRGFMKPIVCCLFIIPATFLVFGNIGNLIGDFLTAVFNGIYDLNPIAAGAFMGFFIQPMVVVGAHWSIVPVSINNVAVNGYDIIMPLLVGAVYGQAGAAFALGLIHKNNRDKRRIAFQGAFSSVLGVTEPALYGSTVPCLRAMLSACTAGAVGGAIVGMAGTHCLAFAFPSIVTSIAFVGEGFGWFLSAMPISFAVAFTLTMLQKKQIKKMSNEDKDGEELNSHGEADHT